MAGVLFKNYLFFFYFYKTMKIMKLGAGDIPFFFAPSPPVPFNPLSLRFAFIILNVERVGGRIRAEFLFFLFFEKKKFSQRICVCVYRGRRAAFAIFKILFILLRRR